MTTTKAARPPAHPWLVFLVAVVLPGMGQVVNQTPVRGLVFDFYILLLGIVTFQLTTPDHSWVGRFAGALFVYAMSLLDAYKWALVRRHRFEQEGGVSS